MNSQLKKNLRRDIFRSVSILTILLSLLIVAFYFVYHENIWYGDDKTYYAAQLLKRYVVFIYLFMWTVDIAVIWYRYWNRSLEYINTVAEAGKQLVAVDDELIHLPSDLQDLEDKLNQAKFESMRNARLAKEAEQRKNDLIVYLAHDLKTPLTSVIGYLTLLCDEKELSPQLREKYLGISLDRAEHLEDLINEFFEITRFNLSNLSLECSQLNLTRMLQQITFEFGPLFREKQLKCTLDIQEDLSIRCDIDKIERVFDNLLRNAVNYSFTGGEIHIAAHYRNAGVEIVFTNQGNTIPKEKLERIFEQFFRLDSSRASNNGGAGLGLAIAKEIVELHNGTIEAESENEQIVFKIRLPLTP